MTTQQINRAIDQEIWKMRDNEEAMRKMLDVARIIRIMYLTPHILDDCENEQQQLREKEAERRFRSLRGCWNDDIEDADRMERAILDNSLEKRILALENEPDGFFKMAGILGRCDTPINELREEALYDKSEYRKI